MVQSWCNFVFCGLTVNLLNGTIPICSSSTWKADNLPEDSAKIG